MTDYVDVGTTPCEEDCLPCGHPDSRAECARFRDLCRAAYPIPEGINASWVVKGNPHDFGTYYEVNVKFDDRDEAAAEFAYHMQDTVARTWAELEALAARAVPCA